MLQQIPSADSTLSALDAISATPAPARRNLLGCRIEELEQFASERGLPAFRGRQLFTWLFARRAQDFGSMTNLPKALRQAMGQEFDISRPRVDTCQVSQDGTRKYRFLASDNTAFEAVYIPEVAKGAKTNTLCVSSQSGCAVGCKFCFTASLKRNRNLTPGEIVGQVLAVRDDVAALGEDARVTNIVFMGMGEPLLNYANVTHAVHILLDPNGADFSSRRITISTSGIVPRIYDLGRDVPTQLAISLNATTDAVRTQIMPINKKWPLAELTASLRAYPLKRGRRITVEYVLLGGLNDSLEDAQRLPELLKDISCKINLLPLNPHERTVFTPPSKNAVMRFQDSLWRAGFQHPGAHAPRPRHRRRLRPARRKRWRGALIFRDFGAKKTRKSLQTLHSCSSYTAP